MVLFITLKKQTKNQETIISLKAYKLKKTLAEVKEIGSCKSAYSDLLDLFPILGQRSKHSLIYDSTIDKVQMIDLLDNSNSF